jgi:DNA-binding response OmpR family regulator
MRSQTPEILVAESDNRLAQALAHQLEALGYGTKRTSSARETLQVCQDTQLDLIIVDWELIKPADGITLRSLREGSMAPLLLLVPRNWDVDYWDLGANDCISKPFSWKELQGRTKALLSTRVLPDTSKS